MTRKPEYMSKWGGLLCVIGLLVLMPGQLMVYNFDGTTGYVIGLATASLWHELSRREIIRVKSRKANSK